MAACIDPAVWQQAVSDCQRIASVKGLGAPNYVRTGMRGLGVSITGTVSPSSALSFLTGGSLLQTAPPRAAAPAPPTGYKSALVPAPPSGTTSDPCALIASGTPCSTMGGCPPGFNPVSIGPGETNCQKAPPSLTAAPVRKPPPGGDTAVMTPAPVVATAGFNQWGLLAALAVGGFVVYKVATHKKSS